LIIHILQQLI